MKNENVNLIVTPHRSAVLIGHNNKQHILVRVQAPPLPKDKTKQRQSYGVSFVIDRSGSMSGEPLEEAVRCAGFMADRLRDDDLAALVTFDNRVALEAPLAPLLERNKLRAALGSIRSGGNTNLHGGWREGADELQRNEPAVALKRVVLLSDGCANEGITDPVEIARQASELAALGVTTSTYGLGRNFNEELMVELAKSGQGNHYYAETANDLLESFNEEFELMANLWSKGLTLKVHPADGISCKVLNDYPASNGNPNAWCLPNIAYGSEAWAMLEVTIPAGMQEGAMVNIIRAEITGQDIDGNDIRADSPLLALPALNSAAFSSIAEDELVSRRLDEVMAAQYLNRARQAVRQGDWAGADRVLEEARAKLRASPWVQEVLASMEKLAARRDEVLFSKEAHFSERKMNSRLSSTNESPAMCFDSTVPAFLRRKTVQGKAQFVKSENDSAK